MASDWPDLLAVVDERVKPFRLTQDDESAKRLWWRFSRPRRELYQAISGLNSVMVTVQTAKHLCVTILPKSMIYDQKLIVFALQGYAAYAVIQSRIHDLWARFFGSTFEDRPVYAPDDCLMNFPFPDAFDSLSTLMSRGSDYYEARAELMRATNQGMTATYNRFCDPNDQDPAITHLRDLHAAMDRAVLDAYGWTDLHPVAIHEREWEAEDGDKPAPWRLRWPEADRDEVLARLLDLNRRRKADEYAQDTPTPKPPRRPRGRKPLPGVSSLLD